MGARNKRAERAGSAAIRRAAIIAWALAIGGCVAPEAFEGVSRAQREAIVRLEVASAADGAAMRAMAAALLDAQRERLLTRLEAEIVARYLSDAGGADARAIDAAVDAPGGAAADAPGLLVTEVREGRMTRRDLQALAHDYGAAEHLTDPGAHRRALLSRLGPVVRHDEAARALLGALGARSADASALFADALASVGSMRAALGASAQTEELSRGAALALWREAIAAHLKTQGARDAGERLLGLMLGGN